MRDAKNGTDSSRRICCDANVIVRVISGGLSEEAAARWAEWESGNGKLIAPQLIRYEATNALYRVRKAAQIDEQQLAVAMKALLGMPISLLIDEQIHFHALELADRFSLAAAYDAHYLAVAMREGTELWTADRRLYNSVSHRLSWVRLTE